MPWIERILKPHHCPDMRAFPDAQVAWEDGAYSGSIYECDKEDCGRRWKLENDHGDWLWVECPSYDD